MEKKIWYHIENHNIFFYALTIQADQNAIMFFFKNVVVHIQRKW